MKTPPRNSAIEYITPAIPPFDLPPIRGTRYQACVPDTLDLAERAALAVHGLTAPTDPEANAELYWQAFFGANRPMMYHDCNDWCEYKYYAPATLLRLASGATINTDVEWHRMATLLQMQGPDGLLYQPTRGRPWGTDFGGAGPMYATDLGDQFCCTALMGRLLEAGSAYHRLTGDDQWRRLVTRAVEAVGRLAVDGGDYAYLDKIIYLPGQGASGDPVPPPNIHHGLGWLGDGLIAAYRMLGSEPALDLGHKFARLFLSHSAFMGPNGEFRSSHGALDFETTGPAHFHCNTLIRVMMLNAGIAAGDSELISAAQAGYEYGKQHGETLMGYFPEFIGVEPGSYGNSCEVCEVADMIYLGRAMSIAGVADCWDDVDRWTRNMLSEAQLLESEWAYRYAEEHGIDIEHAHDTRERVPERQVGAWGGWISPNDWQGDPYASVMACCVGNAARQLFMVWRDMTSYDAARNRFSVHLLLNKATLWADVDSHIPYRGEVVVHVKRAAEIAVRLPEWATPAQCRCERNGAAVQPTWDGRYAVVPAQPGDAIRMLVPLPETRRTAHLAGRDFTLIARGNEIVNVDPAGDRCPIFIKPQYQTDETTWRTVERFVADDVLLDY